MGNRCQQMMGNDIDDSGISAAAPGRSESISSHYMKKRSNSFSSLKKRLSFSFSGSRAGSSLSVKGLDDVSRSSRSDHHQPDETALSSTIVPSSLPPRENPNLNHDVNKEADDFIAKMKEGLKIERKASELEYLDRIQRGGL